MRKGRRRWILRGKGSEEKGVSKTVVVEGRRGPSPALGEGYRREGGGRRAEGRRRKRQGRRWKERELDVAPSKAHHRAASEKKNFFLVLSEVECLPRFMIVSSPSPPSSRRPCSSSLRPLPDPPEEIHLLQEPGSSLPSIPVQLVSFGFVQLRGRGFPVEGGLYKSRGRESERRVEKATTRNEGDAEKGKRDHLFHRRHLFEFGCC